LRPKEIRLGPKEIRLRPKEREMRSVCALRRFVWAPLRHTIVSLTNKCMERLIRKASEKGVTHVRGGVIDATIVSSASEAQGYYGWSCDLSNLVAVR